MTIDELRDRLAELCGYRKIEPQHPLSKTMWVRNGIVFVDCNSSSQDMLHPFPPNDYNALIAAWPEGWRLSVLQLMDGSWWAGGCPVGGVDVIEVDEVPTRYEAELRLTVAVLEATKT